MKTRRLKRLIQKVRMIFDRYTDRSRLAALRNNPQLPLPTGISEEEIRELVTSVRVEGGDSAELQNYAETDFKRFVYTLGLTPEKPGLKVLELGANPYFTTILLYKFRDVNLSLANYFDGSEPQGTQRVRIDQTEETVSFEFQQFNVETDDFPYTRDFFDVVLFCEILEHLLSDPVHALTEIRRVLKPNGVLVLTTPNVARLENVCKIVAGENIYDPYSGYGPYGRHNREYTKHDLYRLLSANGFEIEELFSADVHADTALHYVEADKIEPLINKRQPDLGQYLFSRSRVRASSKQLPSVRPEWLYRSLHNGDS